MKKKFIAICLTILCVLGILGYWRLIESNRTISDSVNDLSSFHGRNSPDKLLVFSTSDINRLLEKNGYKRKFSYNSPQSVELSEEKDSINIYNRNEELAYRILSPTQVERLSVDISGYNFFDHTHSKPFMVFDRSQFVFANDRIIERLPYECRPVFSRNRRYLGRCVIENYNSRNNDYHYKYKYWICPIDNLNTEEALFSGSGNIIHLDSNDTAVFCILESGNDSAYRIIEYNLNDSQDNLKETDIPYPDEIGKHASLEFQDFDPETKQILFTEYIIMGGWFSKEKIWIYDINKSSYVSEIRVKNKGGFLYARFP